VAVGSDIARGTETILVVEDEPSVRTVTIQMLREAGYHVLEARNGDEATQVLAEYAAPIHLVLTDVVMPGMGGRGLAEHVGLTRPETQVLFTSGYTDDIILQQQLLLHDIVLIQKPFTRASLCAKVREVLDAPDVGPTR
jgi:CheY-like chemotaxis protein